MPIIILICIFGVIGLPEFPTSATQVKQNLADRIKLGLDLKGGSHLVLQVQVDEAIGQRCDETIDALTKQLHEKNVIVGEIRRVDDTHILVRNVDPATSATFRDLVNNQFPDWSYVSRSRRTERLSADPEAFGRGGYSPQRWTNRSKRSRAASTLWA